MKAIENIAEVAPSTFANRRGHEYFWTKLFVDPVRKLSISRISDGAKLTWFYLQSHFKQSDEPGYLAKDGKPIPLGNLAYLLGKDPAVLKKEFKELLGIGLISKKTLSGIPYYYDPVMVRDQQASSYENERKLTKDDPSQTLSGSRVEYSKVEESRATERSDYSTTPTTDNKNPPPSGSDLLVVGTTEATDCPMWLESLREVEAYKAFDIREEWRKCVAHNVGKGKPVNCRRFEGWLKLALKHRDNAVNGKAAGSNGRGDGVGSGPAAQAAQGVAPVALDDKLRTLIREATDIAKSDRGLTRLYTWDYFGEDSKLDRNQKIESLLPAVLQAETEGLWRRGNCDGLEICGNQAFWDRWFSGEVYDLEDRGKGFQIAVRINSDKRLIEERRQRRAALTSGNLPQ
jgi:hypothetical protein